MPWHQAGMASGVTRQSIYDHAFGKLAEPPVEKRTMIAVALQHQW
jgi:hypothetical protein